VTSTLIGATKMNQFETNLSALTLELPDEALQELDTASALEPTDLDHFFGDVMQGMVHGGVRVDRTY
jgi:hypothetical protein